MYMNFNLIKNGFSFLSLGFLLISSQSFATDINKNDKTLVYGIQSTIRAYYIDQQKPLIEIEGYKEVKRFIRQKG